MENLAEDDFKDTGDKLMVRPCIMYKEEYKDCTSIKARFHQYFIFGESIDCSQWKKDFDNCERCINGNLESCEAVIESEKKRNCKRIFYHRKNDVWEKRKEPPESWNSPLPENMQKAYKDTYLDHKSREIREGIPNSSERTLCVVS